LARHASSPIDTLEVSALAKSETNTGMQHQASSERYAAGISVFRWRIACQLTLGQR
jgi:hypothetical protein